MDCRSDSHAIEEGREAEGDESASERRRMFAWLHRAEQGTAMTEFVMTLPVFLMLFTGIVALAKLVRGGVEVKIEAATDTWASAQSVFNETFDYDNQFPQIAAVDAMGNIDMGGGSGTGLDMAPTAAQMKNVGLLSGATNGEADRSQFIMNFQSSVDAPSTVPGDGIGSDYPADIADDSDIFSSLPMPTGPFAAFAGATAVSYFGPFQTWAAGIRYGMVQEKEDITVEAAGREWDLGAKYDVLVSPKPVAGVPGMSLGGFVGDYMPVGFSRVAAEQDDCLSSVLEITKDENYDC